MKIKDLDELGENSFTASGITVDNLVKINDDYSAIDDITKLSFMYDDITVQKALCDAYCVVSEDGGYGIMLKEVSHPFIGVEHIEADGINFVVIPQGSYIFQDEEYESVNGEAMYYLITRG